MRFIGKFMSKENINMKTIAQEIKKRNSNIEFLRIITMLMVVTLHMLNFGGLLEKSNTTTLKGFLIWFLESLCFVAVDCYVLIGSYFLSDSKFKIKRIIKLWVQTFFYSILMYVFFAFIIRQELTDILINFIPVLLKNYWFVTCYIVLLILAPFLNKLIKTLSKEQYTMLLFIIIIIFSVWGTIIDPARTINYGGGYSISWFVCLYIIAGYIKRFYKNEKNRKITYFIIYLLMSFVNVLAHWLINKYNIKTFEPNVLYRYFSITVLIAALNLFLFFLNINIKQNMINRCIYFFSSATFGVYLIHENPYFRIFLWDGFKRFIVNVGNKKLSIIIITTPILLFLSFTFIDKIRMCIFWLFSKMKIKMPARVKKLYDKLETELNE